MFTMHCVTLILSNISARARLPRTGTRNNRLHRLQHITGNNKKCTINKNLITIPYRKCYVCHL